MTFFEPQWLFVVIGPLFLVLGMARSIAARRIVPQARTWLILGVLFTIVAIWLWFVRGTPPIV